MDGGGFVWTSTTVMKPHDIWGFHRWMGSRDSVVSIDYLAADLTIRRSNPNVHKRFSLFKHRPDWLSAQPSHLLNGCNYSFPGAKQPGHGGDYSSPSRTMVKNEQRSTSLPALCRYGVDRDNFILPFMVVNINMVFWVVTPCHLVDRYRHFIRTYNLPLLILPPPPSVKDEDSKFVLNVGIYVPCCTASHKTMVIVMKTCLILFIVFRNSLSFLLQIPTNVQEASRKEMVW
jgi:hypothetical protein